MQVVKSRVHIIQEEIFQNSENLRKSQNFRELQDPDNLSQFFI